MITPPRLPANHPDQNIECQEALEDELSALIERAEAVGWKLDDITAAVIALADAYWHKRRESDATESAIAEAKGCSW